MVEPGRRTPFSHRMPRRPPTPRFLDLRPEAMTPAEREAFSLFVLVEGGVSRVRLRAPDGPGAPPACAETDGFEMSADDAMALAPIPHDLPRGQVCLCAYQPCG